MHGAGREGIARREFAGCVQWSMVDRYLITDSSRMYEGNGTLIIGGVFLFIRRPTLSESYN